MVSGHYLKYELLHVFNKKSNLNLSFSKSLNHLDQFEKYIGRMPCFLIGALINYLVIYLMMNVEMNTDNNYMLYLIPSLWGVADGCWQTQG